MRRALLALLASLPLMGASGFPDDGDAASLLAALARQDGYLQRLPERTWPLGDRTVTSAQLRDTHLAFTRLVQEAWGTERFDAELGRRFELVPFGLEAHFTGYHLPLLAARERPDATFRFPLYRKPSAELGRATRAAIEDGGALDGQGLELAWVSDELGRFLLMVQGSGVLRFADGQERHVNYAGANGQPYVSLGKLLIQDGAIATSDISIPAIRSYFARHPERLHGYLLRNPSYVYFTLATEGPYGVSGIPLTAGRAMATDKRLSPSGAIAYLGYPRAVFTTGQLTGFVPSHRFVCDQDTGGAIKGPGRADLYWGAGEEAAAIAGSLNGTGSIAFLLLKQP